MKGILLENSEVIEKLEQQTGCSVCEDPGIEKDYAMPLCGKCRDTLSRPSIPLWIKTFVVVVALLVLYAFSNFPRSLKVAIQYQRAQKAEAAGNFRLAESCYRSVSNKYPDDTDLLVRLEITSFKAGDYETSVETFSKLDGRTIDKDQVAELNDIQTQLDKFAKQDKENAK